MIFRNFPNSILVNEGESKLDEEMKMSCGKSLKGKMHQLRYFTYTLQLVVMVVWLKWITHQQSEAHKQAAAYVGNTTICKIFWIAKQLVHICGFTATCFLSSSLELITMSAFVESSYSIEHFSVCLLSLCIYKFRRMCYDDDDGQRLKIDIIMIQQLKALFFHYISPTL
jgi:hypothetical protein